MTLRIGSLFSGIGGLELGLERAGLGRTVWQVEWDPYCRAVLAKHWPDVERYGDVREFHPPGRVDVICGGFPCQPWSVAGKQRGADDERHLWPEFARIVEEAQPTIVIGENVPGLRARGLRVVLGDLARLGFNAEWAVLSAAEVGAPHIRRRLFVVATHPERIQLRDEPGWLSRACGAACAPVPRDLAALGVVADPDPVRRLEQARRVADERGWSGHVGWRLSADPRMDDGLPRGLDGARRKALGNAVLPQVAEVIGRAITAVIR